MIGYYILASLVIIQGIVALLDGVRYLQFVRESWAQPPADYTPKVAVFAPCKGIDPGFRETIGSLLGQDYPDYEVIFVTETRADPAYHQIWRLLQEQDYPNVSLIEAGLAERRGQKVHNLLRALEQVSDDIEVFAFIDSDATPPSSWLRYLVAPLCDPEVGATTGYRWYIPAKGNFCSLLQSLWNASITTALGPYHAARRRNFTWGGSTAIRRETFEAVGVYQRWLGACTEDYPLSNAVKEHGLYVKFVPQCLIPSRGRCGLGEMLQFTTRQIVITRVYSVRLWLLALITNLMFFGAFYGGLGILLYCGLGIGDCGFGSEGFFNPQSALPEPPEGGYYQARNPHSVLVPVFVSLVYLPGLIKSVLRQKAVEMILTDAKAELKRYRLGYWFLYPLANLVFIYNLAFSAVSRHIQWRGIRYKLVSPSETKIVE